MYPAQHRKYIGKPFPPKFWQQISQSQQFGKNDLHNSNAIPVVHKGEVLLAKKQPNKICQLLIPAFGLFQP